MGPVSSAAGFFNVFLEAAANRIDLGPHQIRRGVRLINQGDNSSAIYFVLAGRFLIERDGHHVNYAEAGSVLGEIAFFTGAPRTATATAYRDSLVYRLAQDDYQAICDLAPSVRDEVARQLAVRLTGLLAHAGPRLRETLPRTAVMLPAVPELPCEAVAHRLTVLLSAFGSVRLVGEGDFRAELGTEAVESDSALNWFSGLERQSDFVLYATQGASPTWQQATVRQADQILLLAREGSPPPPSAMESFAARHIPWDQWRLVLLHPERQVRVTGTRAWLAARPVGDHHHVWLDDDADLARLARNLRGHATGMVCGGGGAFGIAHVGIQAAFTRAGAVFDHYGGTSSGAAMAIAFALGSEPAEIESRIIDTFIRHRALRRPTVPVHAVLDHHIYDAKLIESYGEGHLEDLWIPAFAVAANLDEDRIEPIRRGPIWQAVRASSSLPGILPPFVTNAGQLLVDGGILDNLPYRTMHAIKTGPNLVVSLEQPKGQQRYDYSAIPGRGRMIMDLLTPFRKRASPAPSLAETIIRSMTAGSTHDISELGSEDVLIRPPLPPGMSFLQWRRSNEVLANALLHGEAEALRLKTTFPDLWRAFTGVATP